MKRLSLIVVGALLAVALLLGALFVNGTGIAYAASMPKSVPGTRQVTMPTLSQELIKKADPYIHVVEYTATIDPAISHVLSKTELVQVRQAVQEYNALPVNAKRPTTISVKTNSNLSPATSCGNDAVIAHNVYWWGNAYTLSSCFISTLWWYVYIDGSVAGAVGLICGVLGPAGIACAIFGGLTAIAITATVGALQGADNQCGNRGANLNFPWVGPPFVNAVC